MLNASLTDKNTVIDILCDSFDQNKSVNYVIKQDSRRKRRLRVLMEYSYELCTMFGNVYISDDKKACALVLFPDKKRTTVKAALLDLKLIFQSIGLGRTMKVLKRDSTIKSFYPPEPVYYLWFIGVRPTEQHKGVGGSLLKELLKESDSLKRPVYLETSMIENLKFYTKHGFEVYKELDFGHTLFSMKRTFHQN